jgi:KUP system potassium uptake protein
VITIADQPHPNAEMTISQTAAITATGIYRKASAAGSEDGEICDAISNIRSLTGRLERSISKAASLGESDDDPGLRKPGDFKQKQVRTVSWLRQALSD